MKNKLKSSRPNSGEEKPKPKPAKPSKRFNPGMFLMALIKTSGIGVVEIRNKLGGTVFLTGKGGASIRNLSTPTNPQTASQQLNRIEFGSISSEWRALTPSQRLEWYAQASNYSFTNIWGNKIKPAGNALFVQLNRNLILAGQSTISDPASPSSVGNSLTLTITTNTNAAQVITLDGAVQADTQMLVFATPQMSAGANFFKGKYRLISSFAAAHVAALDTYADYVAKFGAPITGTKISWYVIAINTVTGQAGVPLNANDITA